MRVVATVDRSVRRNECRGSEQLDNIDLVSDSHSHLIPETGMTLAVFGSRIVLETKKAG